MSSNSVKPYEPYIIAVAVIVLAAIALQGAQPFVWLVAILIIVAAGGGGWVIAQKYTDGDTVLTDDDDHKNEQSDDHKGERSETNDDDHKEGDDHKEDHRSDSEDGLKGKPAVGPKGAVGLHQFKAVNTGETYKGTPAPVEPGQPLDLNETKVPLVSKKNWMVPIQANDPALEILTKSIKTLNNPRPRSNLGYRVLQPPTAAVNAFARSAFANPRRLRGHIGETRIPLGGPEPHKQSTNDLVRKMAFTSLQANRQTLPNDYQTI